MSVQTGHFLFYLQIYHKLSTVEHMTVYEKEAIPSRFYYKKGKFVSPLTLVADEGWFITEVIIKSMAFLSLFKLYPQPTGKEQLLRSVLSESFAAPLPCLENQKAGPAV